MLVSLVCRYSLFTLAEMAIYYCGMFYLCVSIIEVVRHTMSEALVLGIESTCDETGVALVRDRTLLTGCYSFFYARAFTLWWHYS